MKRVRALVVLVVVVVSLVATMVPARAFVPNPACPPVICGPIAGEVMRTGARAVAGGALTGGGAVAGSGPVGAVIAGGAALVWGAYELTEWFWDTRPDPTDGGLNKRYIVWIANSWPSPLAVSTVNGGSQDGQPTFGFEWSEPARLMSVQSCSLPAAMAARSYSGGTWSNIPGASSPQYNSGATSAAFSSCDGAANGLPHFGQYAYMMAYARAPAPSNDIIGVAQAFVFELKSDPPNGLFGTAKCTDANGNVTYEHGFSEETSGGSVDPQPGMNIVCPGGSAMTGVTLSPSIKGAPGWHGPEPTLDPQPQSAPWGNDPDPQTQTQYEECLRGDGCDLGVTIQDPEQAGQRVPCTADIPSCHNWGAPEVLDDPALQPECQWGPFVLPIGQCINLEPSYDPQTEGEVEDTPETVVDPYAPTKTEVEEAAQEQGNPDPNPTAEPSEPPVEVEQPTECSDDDVDGPLGFLTSMLSARCAMEQAFKPDPDSLTQFQDTMSGASTKAPFAVFGAVSGWVGAVLPTDPGSGCPNWTVQVGDFTTNPACYPWFVAAVNSLRGTMLGGALLAGFVPLAWSVWRATWPIIKPGGSGA